jgi:tripartite-type tricarboxylate transporter receptor subunit TctC
MPFIPARRAACAALLAAAFTRPALAQDDPARTVRIIVAVAPGGSVCVFGRR